MDDRPPIKPHKEAFCDYNVVCGAVITAFLLLIGFLIFRCTPARESYVVIYVLLGLAVVFNAFRWFILPIEYSKEEYTFEADRIRSKRGSLFSNYEQELLLNKVTHIKLQIPFIQNKLYGTGSILIQSAGGGNVEVNMRSIKGPYEVYEEIQQLLKNNGFQIESQEALLEDRPAGRGVFLEAILALFGMIFMSACGGVWMVEDLRINPHQAEFYILAGGALVFSIVASIFLFRRQMSQRYYLHQHSINSSYDFLGKGETLIPMENLSDSILTQGLIGRFMKLQDFVISCQGSGKEIPFRHTGQGKVWKEKLDILIKEKNELPEIEATVEEGSSLKSNALKEPRAIVKAKRENKYTCDFSMNKKRVFGLPLVILGIGIILVGLAITLGVPDKQKDLSPIEIASITSLILGGFLFVVGLFGSIIAFFRCRAFKYFVKSTSFEEQFRFISVKNVEFNADKITAVLVKEGILDRIFKTCTVTFWSIGSKQHLSFRHITKEEELLGYILAKVGIQKKNESYKFTVEGSLESVIKRNLFFYLILILPTVGLFFLHPLASLAPVFLGIVVYLAQLFYHMFCHLEIEQDFVSYRKGILFRVCYYIHFEDVKYLLITRYPGSSAGELRFEITGEQIVQNDKKNYTVSNYFAVPLVENVEEARVIFDRLFDQKLKISQIKDLEYDREGHSLLEKKVSQPYYKQIFLERFIGLGILDTAYLGGIGVYTIAPEGKTMYALIAVCLLVLLNVFLLFFINLSIRSIRYVIDEQKIIYYWGVFYKKIQAIHFSDVDYIGKNEGFFNKIFKTGNITINTVGSSKTDMTLRNLKDTEDFYQDLKQRYTKK